MTEMGFVTWKIVQLVLWAGPFGVAAFFAVIAAGSFAAGYFTRRRKPKEIAMGHGVPMHVKLDIYPDGSTTPPGISN